MTIFLTTHRLEEAERLCDRVAILNTTLRLIGRPDELREQLFSRSLDVRVRAPLEDPEAVFGALPGVEGWEQTPSGYTLTVSDPDLAAPAVARALVAAGADILSIAESRHSLEDVYLELIDEDVEARRPMSFSRTTRRARSRQGAAGLPPQPLRDRHDGVPAGPLHRPADHAAAHRPGDREASSKLDARVGLSLLYMLMIPAFVPSTLAAYSVVGEREQGTLEPVLITPIRREEFLVGKALAVAVPTLTIAYAIFGIFLAGREAVRPPCASPRRSSQARTCWCSCCSRRCSPAGRSGSGSRSPPARATSAPPSSSASSPACRRSRSSP